MWGDVDVHMCVCMCEYFYLIINLAKLWHKKLTRINQFLYCLFYSHILIILNAMVFSLRNYSYKERLEPMSCCGQAEIKVLAQHMKIFSEDCANGYVKMPCDIWSVRDRSMRNINSCLLGSLTSKVDNLNDQICKHVIKCVFLTLTKWTK